MDLLLGILLFISIFTTIKWPFLKPVFIIMWLISVVICVLYLFGYIPVRGYKTHKMSKSNFFDCIENRLCVTGWYLYLGIYNSGISKNKPWTRYEIPMKNFSKEGKEAVFKKLNTLLTEFYEAVHYNDETLLYFESRYDELNKVFSEICFSFNKVNKRYHYIKRYAMNSVLLRDERSKTLAMEAMLIQRLDIVVNYIENFLEDINNIIINAIKSDVATNQSHIDLDFKPFTFTESIINKEEEVL